MQGGVIQVSCERSGSAQNVSIGGSRPKKRFYFLGACACVWNAHQKTRNRPPNRQVKTCAFQNAPVRFETHATKKLPSGQVSHGAGDHPLSICVAIIWNVCTAWHQTTFLAVGHGFGILRLWRCYFSAAFDFTIFKSACIITVSKLWLWTIDSAVAFSGRRIAYLKTLFLPHLALAV